MNYAGVTATGARMYGHLRVVKRTPKTDAVAYVTLHGENGQIARDHWHTISDERADTVALSKSVLARLAQKNGLKAPVAEVHPEDEDDKYANHIVTFSEFLLPY